jgi:hypothetical protein
VRPNPHDPAMPTTQPTIQPTIRNHNHPNTDVTTPAVPARGSRDRHTASRGGQLTTRLDREWHRLRRDPRALHTARSWARPTTTSAPSDRGPETGEGPAITATPLVPADGPLGAVLHGLIDLEELIAATHRDADDRGDAILLELVAAARTQELAGRIVLQRVLPALLARSHRYGGHQTGQTTADTVVAAAWMTLRTYDHHRRRRHVAASIVSDAVYVAFRQPLRRLAATEQVRSAEVWAQRPADECPTALEELAAVMVEAQQRGVSRHDLDVLRGLVRTGSSAIVAAELGVTARTVRNHRDRAIARVREAVLTDAA